MGFKIRRQELERLCADLPIKNPVSIKFAKRFDGTVFDRAATRGCHTVDRTDPALTHLVVLAHNLTAGEANEAICHELRHGWQREQTAEKFGGDIEVYDKLYSFGKATRGYSDNPFEKDARRFAREATKNYDLIVKEG
jgi:hypothetical protein